MGKQIYECSEIAPYAAINMLESFGGCMTLKIDIKKVFGTQIRNILLKLRFNLALIKKL